MFDHGFVSDFYSYVDDNYSQDSIVFGVELSQKGYENVNEVISAIFNYMKFLKA